jgi:hypothetical protein
MFFTQKIFMFFLVFSVVIVSGCAKYKPKPFIPVPFNKQNKNSSKNNVSVSACSLTSDDCKHYFSKEKSTPKGGGFNCP